MTSEEHLRAWAKLGERIPEVEASFGIGP